MARKRALRDVHAACGKASRSDALMDAYFEGGATVRAAREADYNAIDDAMEGDAQGAVAPTSPGGGFS